MGMKIETVTRVYRDNGDGTVSYIERWRPCGPKVRGQTQLITDFSSPLIQCPEEIVPEVEAKMRVLFDKPELWR